MRQVLVEFDVLGFDDNVVLQPFPAAYLTRKPFDGVGQSEVIEHARPQFRRYPLPDWMVLSRDQT